jgi:hypothetical protein
MAGIVPLISSSVAGPMGVIHLPRLWQKVSLSARSQLAEDYDECGAGFDQMVLDGLKIDREAFLSFVRSDRPSYPQLETWVLSQRGGSIPQAEIDSLNEAVRGYNHADDTRSSILASAGIEDDGSILDAVTLNSIEDWTEFHSGLQ